MQHRRVVTQLGWRDGGRDGERALHIAQEERRDDAVAPRGAEAEEKFEQPDKMCKLTYTVFGHGTTVEQQMQTWIYAPGTNVPVMLSTQ